MTAGLHVFDPTYSTKPGVPARCVCGRPLAHPLHLSVVRSAA